MKKLLCKLGIHIYKYSHSELSNDYYECRNCGKREFSCDDIVLMGGVDYKWLKNEKHGSNFQ